MDGQAMVFSIQTGSAAANPQSPEHSLFEHCCNGAASLGLHRLAESSLQLPRWPRQCARCGTAMQLLHRRSGTVLRAHLVLLRQVPLLGSCRHWGPRGLKICITLLGPQVQARPGRCQLPATSL